MLLPHPFPFISTSSLLPPTSTRTPRRRVFPTAPKATPIHGSRAPLARHYATAKSPETVRGSAAHKCRIVCFTKRETQNSCLLEYFRPVPHPQKGGASRLLPLISAQRSMHRPCTRIPATRRADVSFSLPKNMTQVIIV